MKYTKLGNEYVAVDEATIAALPEIARPELLAATDAGVVAYLAAQAEAAKAFEAKQANKKSALEKLAKVAGLTDDELAALE